MRSEPRRKLARSAHAAALVLLGAAPAVSALTIDFKPLAHAQVLHDDNLYRAPDDPPAGSAPKVADTIFRTGVGAELKLTHSLQALQVTGELDRVDFRGENRLDHDRYRVGVRADLAAGSTVKLTLAADREKRLETFAYRDDTRRGLITVDAGSAELAYAITPRVALLGRGDRFETRATLDSSRDYDITERGYEAGVRYGVDGYSRLDLVLRSVDGDFPERDVTPGDGREKRYDQQSAVLRASWLPSGLTEVGGSLAYVQRKHDDPVVEDFSGVTGRFSGTRRVSGRTQLRLDLYREIYYVEDEGANFVENLGAGLGMDWLYSAKLRFGTTLERYSSRYRGGTRRSSLDADEPRSDQVFAARAGAEWRPFYRFSVTPEYRYEQRESNERLSGYRYHLVALDFAYRYGAAPTTARLYPY